MNNGNNKPLARTIMVQGTASDVGKSILTAAFCRIFKEDGCSVAPFKSQNMSLNSYVTWDGKEIGRAQGMQADACGILATTDMNPILLKPKKDMVSQVVVHGKPLGDFAARVYREQVLAEAAAIVRQSLQTLRENYDIVVLEGAGSPAEINLKDRDIVNMRAADWAEAPVVLVADIDRGGMFASIVGTLELLEPEERDRVCGFIVNKFRGDVSLLQPGLDWLEAKTGKPVLGVVPYLPDLGLEDEDSLSLDSSSQSRGSAEISGSTQENTLDIAVLRLPHISNFTDIDPLRFEPDVRLRFITGKQQWGSPDAVIIPGSKNTVDDLLFLRENGLADCLERHIQGGGHTVGICGGYEMFGERLLDPLHTESDKDETPGFGWFPFDVTFAAEKRTERACGDAQIPGLDGVYTVEGFEIHMGEVHWREELTHSRVESAPCRPFRLRDMRQDREELEGSGGVREGSNGDGRGSGLIADGCASADGRVWGTFLHGILHNDDFRRAWLNRMRVERGLEPLPAGVRVHERREEAFRRLAEHVRTYVDMDRIGHFMGMNNMEAKR
ncbi:cobyric acid synthase [Paenibacillus sp. sptzw28]|uniref:cobyric acid synthase n=1 Tax=Paenibacillus sp. sptzw28 TaxID=715179 RepID=UPI0021624146|nr:cobyric acid synthase [Paenibacillus sp. sptzw28]